MAQEQFPLMTFYSSHQRLEEDMSKGLLRAMISYNQHEGDFERYFTFVDLCEIEATHQLFPMR